MLARNIADAGHARRVAEADRQAPGAGEKGAIRLQPARRAAARQAAIGHHDIGLGAGAHHVPPTDMMRRARGENAPDAAVPSDLGPTQIGTTRHDVLHRRKLALLAGGLGEHVADIIPSAGAQDGEFPRPGAQGQMLAVAGDDEVRSGRGHRPQRAGGDRQQAEPAPAGAPEGEPEPAEHDQGEGRARHGRKGRDGPRRRGNGMGKVQQEVEREPRQPPDRRPEPGKIQ